VLCLDIWSDDNVNKVPTGKGNINNSHITKKKQKNKQKKRSNKKKTKDTSTVSKTPPLLTTMLLSSTLAAPPGGKLELFHEDLRKEKVLCKGSDDLAFCDRGNVAADLCKSIDVEVNKPIKCGLRDRWEQWMVDGEGIVNGAAKE
jgi:hypothetical protein